MITKRTTLILGAGASAPFGFPTGYALLQHVLLMINPQQAQIPREFLARFPRDRISSFRDSLFKSGKASVDAFLEHRPEFIDIGKLAIAMALIPKENEVLLFERNGKNWYEYLFNQLNAKFEDFDKNKLSILTFNYDRSLEHYLFTTLKNSYPQSPYECAKKLKSIPIIHLHGDLGELPVLSEVSARFYKPEINEHLLQIATSRIKIIHEDVANEPTFIKARNILSESEIICFLGFGYHPINMERLGFKKHTGGPYTNYPNAIQRTGSSFGLTNSEAQQINGRYWLSLYNGDRFLQYDVLQFLRESGVLDRD